MQSEFNALLTALEEYKPRKPEYIKERLNLFENATKLYDERKIIIDVFKNKLFPFHTKEPKCEEEYKDEDEDESSPINKLKILIEKKEEK